jgi:cytochrome c oxidase subunit III
MKQRIGKVADSSTTLAHQFDDAAQQRESSTLGMWIFLATEIMFFGGLFAGYTVYRIAYPAAFEAASRHLDIVLGTLNTGILLTSSLTMALAVRCAQTGKRRSTVVFLIVTMLLGGAFLSIKGLEYYQKYTDHFVPGASFSFPGPHARGAEMFFYLYFAMTGLHAIHMIAGIGVMSVIAIQAARRRYTTTYYTPLEVAGLYWHFVDIIWIFLFPLLYLIGSRS